MKHILQAASYVLQIIISGRVNRSLLSDLYFTRKKKLNVALHKQVKLFRGAKAAQLMCLIERV